MTSYKNQIFVSYARQQRREIEGFVNEFHANGLTAWWDKDIPPGEKWREQIETAIRHSRHFLLYCSVHAKASDEVSQEIKTFQDDAKNDPSRKILVLKAPGCEEKHVPSGLGEFQWVDTVKDVIIYVLKEARDELLEKTSQSDSKHEREKDALQAELATERAKVAEARKYYRHRRFWEPFAANKDIHVFTCGRDIHPDDARPRGTAGFRTNIDKWDYRAVLGIAHFFASNYPDTKLTIEDPASKLYQDDIDKVHVLANRIAEVGNLLKDKDCIIIGSPDVNDFAEIVLSRIHGLNPYDNERKKSKGFVLLRERKNTASAFYWQKGPNESEGIARLGKETMRIYDHEPPSTVAGQQRAGKMHGLLVVAENPFSSTGSNRVMILSGFSGVATNAIAKFLCEDAYLPSFFAFDDEIHTQQAQALEAVVSVKYTIGPGSENKDARQIDGAADSITFEELVAL